MKRASKSPLTPGRLWYLVYHCPKRWLQDRQAERAGRTGDIAMRAAAASLPPGSLATWGLDCPPCRFLTGARFFHQTIFCARSFEWACGTHVRIEIFSDGTLDANHRNAVQRALPHATFVDDAATAERLNDILPANRFPVLRRMRGLHPLMRKILDLRVGRDGPSLYLDSDMLFFATPVTLRDWLRRPTREHFMQQQSDALVGHRDHLERTLGQPLLPGVNSGIIAIDDTAIDWAAMENAASLLTVAEQAHKWAEQTLFAWHVSRRGATPLSPADYFLCNNRQDTGPNPPPLRHYVHKSKVYYMADEWRRWWELSQPPSVSGPIAGIRL